MPVKTFIPLVVLAMLSSCTDPTPTDGTANPIVAQFRADRSVYANSTGKTITDKAEAELSTRSSAAGIDGGDVSLSGTKLRWMGSSYENLTSTGDRSEIQLFFDGRFLVFTVSGSPLFAAMVDSIKAPIRPLSVTFPTPTDTVSRSAGFTITWAETGADRVHLLVEDSSYTVGHQNFGTTTNDDGGFTVTPANLATMTTGPITVIIVCENQKIVVRPDERSRTLTITSTYIIFLNLKP